MDSFLHDLRYALRTLVKNRVFTAVAVTALALGIGANTAIFSVVNGVLLRPLPYEAPDRLAMIWNRWEGWPETWISEPEYWDFVRNGRAFENVAAFTSGGRNLTGGDAPERVRAGFSTANIFATLGARPLVGRVFSADEDRPGGARVTVIGHGLWQRRFGGDPAVVGQTILLNDSAATVVGVMPAGFQFPLDFSAEQMDIWLPLQLDPVNPAGRGGHYLNVVARLKPGVTMAAANADVEAVAQRMVAENANQYSPAFGSQAKAVSDQVLGDIRPALLVLLGAVGFVLLIACANVANLLLARAETRGREIAVRTALGAGRRRLVRQLLTESVLLFLLGGAVGLALAYAGVKGLVASAPANMPRVADVGIDARVLVFTLAVSLVTGVVFGLIPAVQATRTDLRASLQEGARGSSSDSRRRRVRRALVISEVALALVLVIGAGLLIKSFGRLRNVDPGFSPDNVLTMQLTLPASRYVQHAETRAFYRAVVERARALPGVTQAAAVRALPLTGTIGDWSFAVEGRPQEPDGGGLAGDWQVVTPDYFRVMRIGLHSGRLVTDADDARAPGAVLINESLARRAFPNGDAIGQRINLGPVDSAWRTVVGVVRDVRHRGLDIEARPEMYLPHAQFPLTAAGAPQRNMYLVVRAAGDPSALATSLRREVAAIDPLLPVSSVRTMEQVLGSWAAERRLSMLVLSVFAMVALALAAVGIYGVMSYSVAQRTREIGIRMALGAEPGSVLGLVVRQGVALALVGVGIGIVVALALTRLMTTMLFQVSPTDPLTFAGLALLLTATALLASWIPARRATRVEPTVALRGE